MSRPAALTRSIMNAGGGPRAFATKQALCASTMSSCVSAAFAENGAAVDPPLERRAAISSSVSGGSSGTS